MKEQEVQAAILDWLAAVRVLAFRMQTGATVSEYKGRTRLIKYGVPGMADILSFPKSGVLWIECKAPGGRQSELQRSFQRQVEEHGHTYVVVESVEDVKAALGNVLTWNQR